MTTSESGVAETVVRGIRAQLGWQHITQLELTRRLGWTQNKLWRRLAGQTPLSLDDVEAIAAALGVSSSDLLQPRGEQHA